MKTKLLNFAHHTATFTLFSITCYGAFCFGDCAFTIIRKRIMSPPPPKNTAAAAIDYEKKK